MSPNAKAMRKPTTAEKAKMERSREKLQEALREEKGLINKMIPTMGKAARDQAKKAQRDYESTPEEVLEYESMVSSEGGEPTKFKKGGLVTARGQGCVMKKKSTRMY
jgi:hypothetical protein